MLHPSTGEVLDRIDATQTGLSPTVLNALYPLHAGKTGWVEHRAVLTVTSLVVCYLSISGLLVYLRRRQRARR